MSPPETESIFSIQDCPSPFIGGGAGSVTLLRAIQPAKPVGGFAMKDYWIWCPSVIRGEDGRFFMFASRWPKSIPFHPGWLTNSEIVLAVADKAEGPYEFLQVVLPPRGAEYWDGRVTHNPRIIKWENSYALFYTGISHPLPDVRPGENLELNDPRVIAARAGKRAGVAISDRMEGPWKRFDEPILPVKPRTFYSFLTSNPAPCVSHDGSILLIFKGRRHIDHTHGSMILGAASAPDITGPYHVLGPIALDAEGVAYELEDPFVWRTEQGYQMIAKDMTGSLCGERQAGIHAFSVTGLHWTLLPERKAYSRALRRADGSVQKMGSVERASLLFQDDRPTHFVAAVADGPGGFAHAHNTWNEVISLSFENSVDV